MTVFQISPDDRPVAQHKLIKKAALMMFETPSTFLAMMVIPGSVVVMVFGTRGA
ncbi:MAG: hypothetical protein WCT28_02945 [Patescibacteria group bacterium]|jgi:hypothetical protein